MEQHAVPRNISSFQFHLIGDMTLRQFGYVAVGTIIGFIVYKTLPVPGPIAIGVAAICALVGFAFAFVPIQERPLDRWILAFIKSILSPTQYVWHKIPTVPDILLKPSVVRVQTLPHAHQEAHHEAREKLNNYLHSLPQTAHQTLNLREKRYVDSTMHLFSTTPSVPAAVFAPTSTFSAPAAPAAPLADPPPPPAPDPIPITPPTVHAPAPKTIIPPSALSGGIPVNQVHAHVPPVSTVIAPVPAVAPSAPPAPSIPTAPPATTTTPVVSPVEPPVPISVTPPAAPLTAPDPRLSSLQKQFDALVAEKAKMAEELTRLKQRQEPSPEIIKPVVGTEKPKRPTIKAVTAKAAIDEIGMPTLPQTPNVVFGIIKDGQKKILSNIILTIKDSKGMPLRALKTNKLGQFITATPLPNGTYFLEVDDPLKRYTFDVAEIMMKGEIFLPIEITAKSEREVIREKLAKDLFGST